MEKLIIKKNNAELYKFVPKSCTLLQYIDAIERAKLHSVHSTEEILR